MIYASEKIRKAHNLPEGWQAYYFEVLGDSRSHIRLDGGVYRFVITRGPRKGATNYRKPAEGSERTVIVSAQEYDEMIKDEINKAAQ